MPRFTPALSGNRLYLLDGDHGPAHPMSAAEAFELSDLLYEAALQAEMAEPSPEIALKAKPQHWWEGLWGRITGVRLALP